MKRARLDGLFDLRIATAEVGLSDPLTELLPDEAAFIRSAGAKRRLEYRAGRHCARAALAKIGISGFPLVPGKDRTPRWPASVRGSLTHTGDKGFGWCGAVVAEAKDVQALGLDAELDVPLDEKLWPLLLTDEERAWLGHCSAPERGRRATLVFSAKECVYKCLYPLSAEQLDFQDVTIRLVEGTETFVARFNRDTRQFRREESVTGRFRLDRGLVITAMAFAGPAFQRALGLAS